MKTTKIIVPILALFLFFACKNNSNSQEIEVLDNPEQTEELSAEIPEKESTIAYLKSYDGLSFEELEEKEKDVKDRMLQFMEDTYFDITAPVNAAAGTCALQSNNDLLTVTGEVFHEGKPHLSILVFDLKNDNILGAIYESDTQTLRSHIEKPNIQAPDVFTKWVKGFQE